LLFEDDERKKSVDDIYTSYIPFYFGAHNYNMCLIFLSSLLRPLLTRLRLRYYAAITHYVVYYVGLDLASHFGLFRVRTVILGRVGYAESRCLVASVEKGWDRASTPRRRPSIVRPSEDGTKPPKKSFPSPFWGEAQLFDTRSCVQLLSDASWKLQYSIH
jgi:hypothetical protein